ncbi:nitrile hydratase accessory protein [Gammaproteobacteria bacterium]|nr:nitrile hydratase accessory protein [Gammaproteobacteria bacterium]
MNEQDKEALKPLASVDGEAAFDEPWQAEALAIADTLVQNGLFSAGAWSQALGEALRQSEASGASDNQQTYYQCVLAALEGLIAQHSDIDRSAMTAKREDWEQAYLSTPHGQPVKLDAIEDN